MLSRKYLLQFYYNYIMSHSFIRYIFLFELASTLYVAYALRDGFCFLSNYSGSYAKRPSTKGWF